MRAIIKDLELRVYSVYTGTSREDGNFSHNVAGFSCNVVIKRDGEFYEVPYHKLYEFDDENIFGKINSFHEGCLKECDKISVSWNLVHNIEDMYGKVIGQTKIEL